MGQRPKKISKKHLNLKKINKFPNYYKFLFCHFLLWILCSLSSSFFLKNVLESTDVKIKFLKNLPTSNLRPCTNVNINLSPPWIFALKIFRLTILNFVYCNFFLPCFLECLTDFRNFNKDVFADNKKTKFRLFPSNVIENNIYHRFSQKMSSGYFIYGLLQWSKLKMVFFCEKWR